MSRMVQQISAFEVTERRSSYRDTRAIPVSPYRVPCAIMIDLFWKVVVVCIPVVYAIYAVKVSLRIPSCFLADEDNILTRLLNVLKSLYCALTLLSRKELMDDWLKLLKNHHQGGVQEDQHNHPGCSHRSACPQGSADAKYVALSLRLPSSYQDHLYYTRPSWHSSFDIGLMRMNTHGS